MKLANKSLVNTDLIVKVHNARRPLPTLETVIHDAGALF